MHTKGTRLHSIATRLAALHGPDTIDLANENPSLLKADIERIEAIVGWLAARREALARNDLTHVADQLPNAHVAAEALSHSPIADQINLITARAVGTKLSQLRWPTGHRPGPLSDLVQRIEKLGAHRRPDRNEATTTTLRFTELVTRELAQIDQHPSADET